jgi:hypothetical protein
MGGACNGVPQNNPSANQVHSLCVAGVHWQMHNRKCLLSFLQEAASTLVPAGSHCCLGLGCCLPALLEAD